MAITSTDYLGRECTLVHESMNEPVKIDEVVKSFRGEPYRVIGGRAPHKSSSQGKVWYGDPQDEQIGGEFYPSVLGLQWRLA
jgi:hypothetical protein